MQNKCLELPSIFLFTHAKCVFEVISLNNPLTKLNKIVLFHCPHSHCVLCFRYYALIFCVNHTVIVDNDSSGFTCCERTQSQNKWITHVGDRMTWKQTIIVIAPRDIAADFCVGIFSHNKCHIFYFNIRTVLELSVWISYFLSYWRLSRDWGNFPWLWTY